MPLSHLHHDHYKTDWHRYNLKRQLVELPPVSLEEYEKRLAAFKESEADKDKKVLVRCESCNKQFSTKNVMDNHLISKNYLDKEAGEPNKSKQSLHKKVKSINILSKKEESSSASRVTDKLGEIQPNDEVMAETHDNGEWENCDEKETIVVNLHYCLFCDHISDSTKGNVLHMSTEHSFFIPVVEFLSDLGGLIATLAAKIHLDHVCLYCNGKVGGFKTVKSVKQHMVDKGHYKIVHDSEVLFDNACFYDYSKIESGHKPEDIAEFKDLYCKLFLKPVASNSKQKVKRVLPNYQPIGYTASVQVAAKTERDISYMKRIKDRYNLKLGMKQNKILQPHFRPQVNF